MACSHANARYSRVGMHALIVPLVDPLLLRTTVNLRLPTLPECLLLHIRHALRKDLPWKLQLVRFRLLPLYRRYVSAMNIMRGDINELIKSNHDDSKQLVSTGPEEFSTVTANVSTAIETLQQCIRPSDSKNIPHVLLYSEV